MLGKALQQSDGGYASRKLWYAIGTSVAILAAGALAAFFPTFRPSLETVVGGLIGTLAIYSGANVGGKLAVGKVASQYLTQSDPPPPPEAPSKPSGGKVEPLPEE
jgi:hypothetical protein